MYPHAVLICVKWNLQNIGKVDYFGCETRVCFLDSQNICRLIPLDKCPTELPKGVGDVMRCIIGMTIVKFIKNELKFLGGNLQNCFGQRCGSVQAIHSLSEAFEQPETQAIRLIDAKNALKLEQRLSLKKTEVLCPFFHLALPYIRPHLISMSLAKFSNPETAPLKVTHLQWQGMD